MTFAAPYFLLLLLLLPLLSWLRSRTERQPAFLYPSLQLVRGITGIARSHSRLFLVRLRWLALAMLVIALARPQRIDRNTRITTEGIDIAVALDLSGSMKAEDFEIDGARVNRLRIARDVLHDFILKRPNDRIGLIAFAGQAYVAGPLTLDHGFLIQNLQALQLDAIEEGTAIGSALTACLNRLRDREAKSRIVILMTDGQNNAGLVPPLTAADAAAALGVKVYTIGVGTHGRAPVPQTDVFGKTTYRQIEVDIDEQTLTAVASRTGGRYFRADDSAGLRAIYNEIDRLEKSEIDVRKFVRLEELFPWCVLCSLVLLLLETILAGTVWRRLP